MLSVITGILLQEVINLEMKSINLAVAVLLLLFSQDVYLRHSPPSLPPCGSYRDCSTGPTMAYNFRINVPSLASCYLFCHGDTQCQAFSYNYRRGNELYKHCFLLSTTDCSGGVDGSSGWVSAPMVCNDNVTALIQMIQTSNNGLLRATK